MPQTTVIPVYRVDYPILAKAQKPGGVTVSSTVNAFVSNVAVQAGGTLYAAGDTITLANGVILTVQSVTGGAVTTVSVTNPGSVASPPANPVAQVSSSGTGTGATFNLTWAGNVPNKGSHGTAAFPQMAQVEVQEESLLPRTQGEVEEADVEEAEEDEPDRPTSGRRRRR
jgi:hypothetical protein